MESLRNQIEIFYGKPTDVISDCLRGFLIPDEGFEFIAADFAAIEARVIAWLAGEESILEIFRTHGKIYEDAASKIYKVPMAEVSPSQRQIGKVAVLALGFGGGKDAFTRMGKGYGVTVSEKEAEVIKTAWREANPEIVSYWSALEWAAKKAILNKTKKFSAGFKGREVTYLAKGSFLFCRLPSSRVICYPYPELREVMTPWGQTKEGITFMAEGLTRKFERHKTFGGSLAENVTQAVARDLEAEAMLRLEERHYPVVMHTHDEIVCEVKKGFGSVDEMVEIMTEIPTWAKDLPIKAEGWRGNRYRK